MKIGLYSVPRIAECGTAAMRWTSSAWCLILADSRVCRDWIGLPIGRTLRPWN